jgi:hypothetical protein
MTERAKHRYAEPAWSDAEVALLINKWHGPYKSMTTIADEMTRECRRQITKDAIAARIDRLKKKGVIVGRPNPVSSEKYGVWPKTEIDTLLAEQANNPGLSVSQLAAKLTTIFGRPVSKSSTANKLRRLTGEPTAKPRAMNTERKGNIPDEPKYRSQPRALPPVARQRPGAVEPCCFVTSEGKPWRYCDAPSLAGKVYCAEHYEMSVFKRDATKIKEMRA